jgi:hypothetical protein
MKLLLARQLLQKATAIIVSANPAFNTDIYLPPLA